MSLVSVVQVFVVFVGVLVATAWSTVLERKLLALSQRRKGPNKVGVVGSLQPLADAAKLFLKMVSAPSKSFKTAFFAVPPFALGLTLCLTNLIPFPSGGSFYVYSVLLYFCLVTVHVYTVIASGWGSFNVFTSMGALRAVLLTISYEIPMMVLFMSFCLQLASLDFCSFSYWHLFPLLLLNLPVSALLFVLALLEFHRAPFDLPEAESELVSGFNTEYGSIGFVFIFLSEYANMLIACALLSLILIGPVGAGVALMGLFLMCRAAYPRVNKNSLISSCWKSYLPASFVHFFLTLFLVIL